AIGGANLKQARASTTANEDVQKLSRLWLQIQHLLAAFLLLSIVLLPGFVQLGQEDANINISHGFSLLMILSLTRRLMASKQPSGTVTQQAFRSLTQVLDDLSGGLLPRHQPYPFACINMGEIVVLAGDGLCKLLARFIGLGKRIDVGVPL